MNRRIANAYHVQYGAARSAFSDALLRRGQEPPLASHLVTPRALYSHHGIYIGNGRVIHYAGLKHGFLDGPVEEISLEHFARGRCIRIRDDPSRFDCREAVERARSRLGECRYRLLTNNCEHFCAWVLHGESRSMQVERLRGLPSSAWSSVCAILELGLRVVAPPKVSVETLVRSLRLRASAWRHACAKCIACERMNRAQRAIRQAVHHRDEIVSGLQRQHA